MQLGFVSAILPDLTLEEVVRFAAGRNFSCVELMCWPRGRAERRYAGVTHLDVADFTEDDAARVNDLMLSAGIAISGLGYYPNLLAADHGESQFYGEHLRRVIAAARLLGVRVVNTFIGRDPQKSVAESWPRFREVWRPLVDFAAAHNVKIAIENCPMLFTADEWPGGKNLAYSPAIWRHMFDEIPHENFGLNYDPSHFIWQQIDYLKPLAEFSSRIFHVHLKDARLDRERLAEVGVLATPLEYHSPVLPGRGEVDWPKFFAGLRAAGYDGAVCIEVEDREYESSLERRLAALVESRDFITPYLAEGRAADA